MYLCTDLQARAPHCGGSSKISPERTHPCPNRPVYVSLGFARRYLQGDQLRSVSISNHTTAAVYFGYQPMRVLRKTYIASLGFARRYPAREPLRCISIPDHTSALGRYQPMRVLCCVCVCARVYVCVCVFWLFRRRTMIPFITGRDALIGWSYIVIQTYIPHVLP